MTGFEHAVLGLRQALDAPRRHHVWRWVVRHRIAAVKEALAGETSRGGDAWLAAREMSLHRERAGLLRRLTDLGPLVLEAPDVESVRADLSRLVADLERHRQHLNDLVYDSVSLELGGSE
jgi:membrane protein required for beta-lactamase induction